jgi:hypothetical protein
MARWGPHAGYISSDWPVCALSEISQPRRMGAALTYARRYALFTMVGIAGEDDLDAPDVTNEQPKADKTAGARLGSGGEPTPVRSSQPPIANPNIPSVREKLSVDDSAAIRVQLIREIETLPEDDLQPRAIAILKAKNRLSADDAKQVETAFAARMAPQGASPEALTADEPTSAPTDPSQPQPPLASTDAVKPPRPRGRPRKVKAATEQSGTRPVISKPIDDNLAPASTYIQDNAAPAKIDKSVVLAEFGFTADEIGALRQGKVV